MNSNNHIDAWVIILTEYLFILLPFIVIGIVKTYSADFRGFIEAPDWSFAASILFGQLLVKLVSGSLIHQKVIWQRVSLLIALILVFGLIPSLTTLTLILISEGKSSFVIYAQVFLFVVASILFFILGSAAQSMIENSEKKKPK
ncbi:hypothetical protein [Pseudoalteromonas luteoviolacea]|uniref:Uncharacterized protein n=1 Tax=Pseudoalteromonas luteoviolacea S4054 TaxID=1129367 RepID=A0A0F6AIG0_9GAMM|nr:hypothetical protein [Pseudoalteromonas luteoviolacea]AOT10439.1 hypothetical protein S4054249_21450 [Pseudoalteromonas luteoviolacea]AOT15491.1 hypothetical protein S40542_22140 [Pseudoalteromonas luteoviolacea]AOT20258.1 hypothetical protein S4054_21365 [Pseudoalteromonas luteoviolacea]KKE85686.1 hypothetical protein N479_25185 [Pseudoalteromonas luteoviolacea S4054]KZN73169.1 hypothetical protein N481_13180 [Pseudoalteromonas luteoviolacea S4047-1]